MGSSAIEKQLRRGIATGVTVGPRHVDPGESRPTISAEVIAELLRKPVPPEYERRSQLRLRNALIEGRIELSSSVLRSGLFLESCHVAHGVDLSGALADIIVFRDCDEIGPVHAAGLRTRRSFAVVDSRVGGAITLSSATIQEHLSFAGSTITGEGDDLAVSADGVQVGDDIDCSAMHAHKNVRFGGAEVKGRLVFNGAELAAANDGHDAGICLFADSIRIDGDLFFKEGFKSTGTISLVQASIASVLSLEGATLTATEAGEAAGCSLRGDGLRVGANLFCRNGIKAQGAVRLKAAKVGGESDFNHSQFHAVSYGRDKGGALRANAMNVAREFSCKGLECSGRFEADGAVVGDRIDFCEADLAQSRLILAELKARELCVLWATPPSHLNLADVSVDIYRDTPLHVPCAPQPLLGDPPLTLRGFQYGALANVADAKGRLAWVEAAQGPLRHEPALYAGLEREYRRQGNPNGARLIAIGRHRAARVGFTWWQTAWSYLLDYTVGFGYRLWGAGVWLVMAILVGSTLLAIAGEGGFTEVQPHDRQPAFNPLLYAIDSTIPSLDVGQQRFWVPEGWWVVVELGLAGVGYVLAAALIAGGASVLARDRSQSES